MLSRRAFVRHAALAAAAAPLPAFARAPQPVHAPRKPGTVQTVQGPIDAAKLGFTLAHEHLFSSSAGIWQVWPELLGGRTAFLAKAVDRLKQARDEGIGTIVDLTTADLGRNIRLMEEVSRRSGMQIVACTGHWLYPSLSMSARTVEELAEFFHKEVERGIEDTDIKAGVIKVATDEEGVTPFIEKVLRAAARVSKATGVPVETHTLGPARSGDLQAAIFEEEGIDAAKVSIGHSDDSVEMSYLTGLIERGYFVGMDHMSRGILPPGQAVPEGMEPYLWPAKAERLKALVDAGYAGSLLLSNDWIFADSAFATGTVEVLDSANPDGMLFLSRKFIPHLKQIGVTDDAIRTMTVDNPRRFFGGV